MRVRRVSDPQYRLEPTAAVVMQWAHALYAAKSPAGRYVARLDLGAAKGITRQCHDICDWYGEVILNRKHLITDLVCRRLRMANVPHRVVILGSGKSPLALEVLERCDAKVARVIEVDTRGLAAKKKMMRAVAPRWAGKIIFVSDDVVSSRAERAYVGGRERPAIIVVEGLSYYISRRKLERIIRLFRSPKRENLLIIEYLLPYRCVARTRRYIPRRVLDIARRIGGLPALTHYTGAGMATLLERLGGSTVGRYTLKDMERRRTGVNRYFKCADEGWIECMAARI